MSDGSGAGPVYPTGYPALGPPKKTAMWQGGWSAARFNELSSAYHHRCSACYNQCSRRACPTAPTRDGGIELCGKHSAAAAPPVAAAVDASLTMIPPEGDDERTAPPAW